MGDVRWGGGGDRGSGYRRIVARGDDSDMRENGESKIFR